MLRCLFSILSFNRFLNVKALEGILSDIVKTSRKFVCSSGQDIAIDIVTRLLPWRPPADLALEPARGVEAGVLEDDVGRRGEVRHRDTRQQEDRVGRLLLETVIITTIIFIIIIMVTWGMKRKNSWSSRYHLMLYRESLTTWTLDMTI